jgi:hypothetical protein
MIMDNQRKKSPFGGVKRWKRRFIIAESLASGSGISQAHYSAFIARH